MAHLRPEPSATVYQSSGVFRDCVACSSKTSIFAVIGVTPFRINLRTVKLISVILSHGLDAEYKSGRSFFLNIM